jgi:uncharacterized repeat protein (TIGR01451 family)
MRIKFLPHLWMLFFCVSSQADAPSTELLFSPDAVELTPAAGTAANKARLLRLTDGTLIVAWHEGVDTSYGAWGLDGVIYAPRDIFFVASSDGGISWTDPVNVSNTAHLTDASVFYDRAGDGTGLANYPGDSDKATLFAAGQNLVITWNDTYCGDGIHGPAQYKGPLGLREVPYHCLYAARVMVSSGNISVITVDRLTDGARDVKNETARGTGAGFALAWQEDPAGLQLGEARGEGDGASGARVTRGTDIWYAWLTKSEFANPDKSWHGPVPISDNFDYENATVTGGGASRPIMAMAGSPAFAVLAYEETKNSSGVDVGKYVRFHQFPFKAPQESAAGVIVSTPSENARRARIVAASSPGDMHGTRMLLMWRQGEGIQGAPADFMMRVASVKPGSDLGASPDAGFRVEDLWPLVDPEDPLNNELALNISGAKLSDPTSVDPLMAAKAHRAVLDGDFIFVAYVQDPNVKKDSDQYQYFVRWSDDGGLSWSAPTRVSAGMPNSADIIEPRLIRTPRSLDSGIPEDVRNAEVFVAAWGTAVIPEGAVEPIRDALFVTRTVDRGLSFERAKALDASRTAPNQTDEQIQLRVTPDGQKVYAVWIRRGEDQSDVIFNSAVGITPTSDLSVSVDVSNTAPDVGDAVDVTVRVENSGPQSATELQLSASLPPGLILTSATPSSGTCDRTVDVKCELADLAPDASATLELSLVAGTRGSWSLAAAASAWEMEREPADNSAEVVIDAIPHADVSLVLAVRSIYVEVGDILEIDYEVANSGPQTAKGANVKFMISANAAISVSSRCQHAEDLLSCEIPDLPIEDEWRDTLVLHATSTGIATIIAIAGSQEDDPDPGNNIGIAGVFFQEEESALLEGGGGGTGVMLPSLLLLCLAWRLKYPTIGRGPSAPAV